MNRLPAGIILALSGALILLSVPSPGEGGPAIDLLRALAVTGAWTLAAMGAGGALLARLAPALLQDARGTWHALGAGLLVWSLLALGLAALGWHGETGRLALAAILSAGWLTRPALRLPHPCPEAAVGIAVIVFFGVFDVLAPPLDTDELYYQLALPRQLAESGALIGGFLQPDASRPLTLHLPLAALWASGGEAAPRLFHLLLAAGCLDLVTRMLRGQPEGNAAIPVALLVGSWSFTHEVGIVGTNLPAAWLVLLALDAGLRGQARGLALAAGTALSLKYTAAGPLVGVFLVAELSRGHRLLAGGAALALLSPWWLRNALEGLHPLFPYAGWPGELRFQYLEKYGVGRDLGAMLALPWNAVMTAEITSFRFLGRLSPAWLAAVVPLALALRSGGVARRVALAGLVACVAWAMGPHWLRHLLVALPVLALAVGLGLAQLPRGQRGAAWALGLLVVVGLPANVFPLVQHAGERVLVVSGAEPREAFLDRQSDAWEAVAHANRFLPDEAVVALFFDWSTYLLDRRTVLGSVEDHIPTRHWLLEHGDQSLEALTEQGVTHVLVGRTRFLRKAYPFLSESELQRDFDAPVALLDALLLERAVLIFQTRRSRLYRLEPALPKSAPPSTIEG